MRTFNMINKSGVQCTFVVLLCVYLAASDNGGIARKPSPIYAVMEEIFDGYKPLVRPVKSPTTVTDVNVTFNLMSINKVDEKEQTLTQTFFLDLIWFDEHLAWNSSKHGGLDHLIVPQENVWLPDLAMTPFAQTMQKIGYDKLPLRVESSGRVWWQPSGVFTTLCEIDISYYPFDKQICKVRLEAWASRKEDLALQIPGDSKATVSDKLLRRNSGWQLLSVVAKKDDIVEEYGEFTAVALWFTLRRRPTFPLLTMAVPTLLLAVMSTLVFALPARSGEKMSLGVTVFLTFVVSLSIVLEELPHSSLHVSLHIVFLCALCTCSALFVMLSLVVLRLHQRHYSGERPVGKWWAGFAGCVRRYRKKGALKRLLGLSEEKTVVRTGSFVPMTPTFNETENEEETSTSFDTIADLNFRASSFQRDNSSDSTGRSRKDSHRSSGVSRMVVAKRITQEEMYDRREEQEEGGDVTWAYVAHCLDFVLFRCFFGVVFTGLVLTVILVIVQYCDESDGEEWGQLNPTASASL